MNKINRILISRTDNIGDVVLTLPMAGIIKQNIPGCRIYFLGKSYTKEIILLSKYIDEFINYDDWLNQSLNENIQVIQQLNLDVVFHVFPNKNIASLMKAAKVPIRIGTLSRIYHFFTCNKLICLKRKNSNLHETELNLKLLKPIGTFNIPDLDELYRYYGIHNIPLLPDKLEALIDHSKVNVILHPKSKGSAREWGIEKFISLADQLPSHKYKLFVSGTNEDASYLTELKNHPNITFLAGSLSLKEFVAFISRCQILIAASTGPLHIAAALNVKAIGLFAPMRPIFPTRWKPLGARVEVLVEKKTCRDCINKLDCACIRNIKVAEVIKAIEHENRI